MPKSDEFTDEFKPFHYCHHCNTWTAIETSIEPGAFDSSRHFVCKGCQHLACRYCNIVHVKKRPFSVEEAPQMEWHLPAELAESFIAWRCAYEGCSRKNNLELATLPQINRMWLGMERPLDDVLMLNLAAVKCEACGEYCEPRSQKTWIVISQLWKELPTTDGGWKTLYEELSSFEHLSWYEEFVLGGGALQWSAIGSINRGNGLECKLVCHVCQHCTPLLDTTEDIVKFEEEDTAVEPFQLRCGSKCGHSACGKCDLIRVASVQVSAKDNEQEEFELPMNYYQSQVTWYCTICQERNTFPFKKLRIVEIKAENGEPQRFLKLNLANLRCGICAVGRFKDQSILKTWVLVDVSMESELRMLRKEFKST